jgi:acetylornithine deacetylase/succinyl-diaminopimelate desuccinylase-like protein
MHDPVALLADLIRIDSRNLAGLDAPAPPPVTEEGLCSFLEGFLEPLGFACERQYAAPGRPNLVARRFVAESTPWVALEAHMDTVGTEGMSIDPFVPVERHGRLYGRGSTDTKASMAAMLCALERAIARGLPLNLMFIGACAEESGCEGIGHARLAPRPCGVIVGEPTCNRVIAAHKSHGSWTLHVHGRAAHSSCPELGENAIYSAAAAIAFLRTRVLPRLEQHRHVLLTPPTLSVTMISGGTRANIIPQECCMTVNVRLLPGQDVDRELQRITEELRATGVRVDRGPLTHAPALNAPLDHPLFQALTQACTDHDRDARPLGVSYCTDAGVLSAMGIPAVVFGPGDIANAHSADESVDTAEVRCGAQILEQALVLFAAGASQQSHHDSWNPSSEGARGDPQRRRAYRAPVRPRPGMAEPNGLQAQPRKDWQTPPSPADYRVHKTPTPSIDHASGRTSFMADAVLQPLTFSPLPLGQVRPRGWLADQLRIQADGLSGHLDEFWPDIRDSRWFGGDAEGWERAPYWLDGVIPLAYCLDDASLKKKVERYVTAILDRQQPDGWLGPEAANDSGDRKGYDIWALFLALKMLTEYGSTGTATNRVQAAIERCLYRIEDHVIQTPLFSWGRFRWFESLIPIYWLLDRRDCGCRLVRLAHTLKAQGFDWPLYFEDWPNTRPTPRGQWNQMAHVVNNAMAVKSAGLWYRLSRDSRDRAQVYRMMGELDQFHGTVTGVFTGDECLAGLSPVQGTELCAVVEYMYSLEQLIAVFGDPMFADRLERIAYNALPATFSPDMWSHQYDQQVNQVECSARESRTWNTNGPEANLFGLEPNYGCCTANLSQGWPKFAASLWMRSRDNGLAAVAYGPCEVRTTVQGVNVEVTTDTEYPFRDTIEIQVRVAEPVRFPLHLHVPGWARDASLTAPDGAVEQLLPGAYHRLERDWQGTETLTVHLPMTPMVSRRQHNAVVLERGPLVYALKVEERWEQVHADQPLRQKPHADYEVYPESPWNVALDLDEANVGEVVSFEERAVGRCPFSPDNAPVVASVPGAVVADWTAENGSATATPESPVAADSECTNLRITEFPSLRS